MRGATRRLLVTGAPVLASIAGVAGYALAAGQDINWDSQNYHFYLPWALLQGRLETDFAAAGIQTFLNPLVYVPYHLLVTHLPPRAATFVLAALQALSLVPVTLLARQLLAPGPEGSPRGPAILATVASGTAPLFLCEAGTSFADNLVSLPLLAAVLLASRAVEPGAAPASRRRLVALLTAGFLVGAAAGLKMTCAVYAVGFLAALVVALPGSGRVRLLVAATGGMAAGWMATGGAWALKLWRTYDSPVFPFFNDLFRSPLYPERRFADARFLPASAVDALGYPFRWMAGSHPTSEVPFRDARFAVVLVLALAVFVAWLVRIFVRRGRAGSGAIPPGGGRLSRAEVFLVVFVGVSGALWLKAFAIHRYIVTLELLSGLLIAFLFLRLFGRNPATRAGLAVLLLAVIAWGRPANYGRIPWGDSWFGVTSPAWTSPDTLFVMFDFEPVSFAVPFLPPTARHVRITGDMGISVPLGRQAVAVIGAHAGPLRTLGRRADPGPEVRGVLSGLGLEIADGECATLPTRAGSLSSCPLHRAAVAALDWPGPVGAEGGSR